MAMHEGRVILTIDEVCRDVGVSRRTVYNWIAGKKVQFTRTAGGSIRIYEDSLYRSDKPTGQTVTRYTGDDDAHPIR